MLPVRRHHTRLGALALAAGLLGLWLNTALPVRLTAGVDIVFGYVPVIMVALIGGWAWGLLAATIAGVGTMLLWGHPHAAAIYIIEGGVIGALGSRYHPTLLAIAVWCLIGWPYYALISVLGSPAVAGFASAVVIKAIFQEAFASLLAVNLLLLTPIRGGLRSLCPQARLPLVSFRAYQLSFVALLVLTTLGTVALLQARQVYSEERTLLAHFNERTATAAANEVTATLHGYAATMQAVAEVWGQVQPALRQEVARQALAASGMRVFAWTDGALRVQGGWLIEPSGSLRPIRAGDVPADLSGLSAERAGQPAAPLVVRKPAGEPELVVAVPRTDGPGYLLGIQTAKMMTDRLLTALPLDGTHLHLRDAAGRLITKVSSIGPDVPRRRLPAFVGVPENADDVVSDATIVPWRWTARVVLPGGVLEAAVADTLWRSVPTLLALMGVLSALSLGLTMGVGGELRQLRRVTTRLAELGKPFPAMPDSAIREVRDLYAAYLSAATSLRETVQELRSGRAELGLANSQLEATVDELKTLDRNRSEVINALSHDIKIPLTAVVGYTELLEDELGGPLSPDQRGYVNGIGQNAKRVIRLLEDLLDLARLGVGRFPLSPEAIDLEEALSATGHALSPLLDQKRLRLEVEISPGTPPVWADPVRLGQVINNLLSNAIKFTPEGGRVWMRALPSADGRSVTIQIADTGIGVAPEHLPHLFERFYRVKGTQAPGTGLGLAISKKLIEAMGGTIGVLSEPRKGSTFWFTLPLAAAPVPEPPTDRRAPA